jgi:hypothetical protein
MMGNYESMVMFAGAQTTDPANRWVDCTLHELIDSVDHDCTFWYMNPYQPTTLVLQLLELE